MEKERFEEKESIELIADMIARTKHRLCIGDGNIMLLWGYLAVAVALLVWVLLVVLQHPAVNWLWFLIWIIGGSITPKLARKSRDKSGVTSYVDRVSQYVEDGDPYKITFSMIPTTHTLNAVLNFAHVDELTPPELMDTQLFLNFKVSYESNEEV